jgi:hypothetical protein
MRSTSPSSYIRGCRHAPQASDAYQARAPPARSGAAGPLLVVHPTVQLRLGQATPPGLIGEPQRPVGVLPCHCDQAVTLPFFRAFPGSGLVIQCLPRSQPMPNRSRVWQMVCPLTWVCTIPSATLTSSAKASVQMLVGLWKSRGLRCKSAQPLGLCGTEGQPGAMGTRGLLLRQVSPDALKACSASSTVWSLMPSIWAMRGERSRER